MAKRLVLLKEQEAVHENNAEEKDDKLEHALFKTDGLMEFGNKIGTGDIDEHASRESGDKGHGRFNNSSKAEDSESAEDGKESRNEIEQKGFGARKSGVKQKAEIPDFLRDLVKGDGESRRNADFRRHEKSRAYRRAV